MCVSVCKLTPSHWSNNWTIFLWFHVVLHCNRNGILDSLFTLFLNFSYLYLDNYEVGGLRDQEVWEKQVAKFVIIFRRYDSISILFIVSYTLSVFQVTERKTSIIPIQLAVMAILEIEWFTARCRVANVHTIQNIRHVLWSDHTVNQHFAVVHVIQYSVLNGFICWIKNKQQLANFLAKCIAELYYCLKQA